MSAYYNHSAEARFRTLFQNTGQGSTGFAKAAQNIANGHFDGKAISPELRAVKPNEPGYNLIKDPNGILPPLRFPIGGHLSLPSDPINRKAFIEWFFASLTAERRLPEPPYQSREDLVIDVPSSRDDIVAVSSASVPRQKKKSKKTNSVAAPQQTTETDEDEFPVRRRKRAPKRVILSDDEDEPTSGIQHVNLPI
jgi:hypothetical protein